MKKFISIVIALGMIISLLTFVQAAIPAEVGLIQAAEGYEPYPWAENTKDAVSKAIIAEYKAQAAKGFNVGEPEGTHGYAHEWGGFVAQNFVNGDSTANVPEWGANYKNVSIIMVETPTSQAFTIQDSFLLKFAAAGSVAVAGCATSNVFSFDGYTYQRFTEFFFRIKDGRRAVEVFHFDEADEIKLVIPASALGATYKGGNVTYGNVPTPTNPPSATSTPAPTSTSTPTPKPTQNPANTPTPTQSGSTDTSDDSSLPESSQDETGSLSETSSDISEDTSEESKDTQSDNTNTESGDESSDDTSETETETGKNSSAWIWIVIAVIILAAAAGFIIYLKKFKK